MESPTFFTVENPTFFTVIIGFFTVIIAFFTVALDKRACDENAAITNEIKPLLLKYNIPIVIIINYKVKTE